MWRYPVFAFICYVSIHLEILRRWCDLLQRNSLSAAGVQMRLMKLDRLFVAKGNQAALHIPNVMQKS
jgi:hypothetical protein